MPIKISILLVFVSLSICCFSLDKDKYPFPAVSKVNVPDSLKDQSAFFVENIRIIDLLQTYETRIIVFQRVYINSQEAAEKYSKKELFISNQGNISMIDAQTVKKDGRIIHLSSEQIISTNSNIKNKYAGNSLRRIQLIYPEVEVGDIVDFAYELNLDYYIFSDLLYLEDEIPSLHSRITLRNISELDLTAYSLNNMPKMAKGTDGGVPTLTWEKYGVKEIKTEGFNAVSPVAPAAVFVLWKREESLDYKTIYTYNSLSFPDDLNSISSYRLNFIEQGALEETQNDFFIGINSLINYFKENYTWNTKNSSNASETLKFLKLKTIDTDLFLRYVRKLARENNLRVEKGFTKSLLDGPFVQGYVSLEQLQNPFLVIYDADENPHFLFPPESENEFYYLDEIPFYLEGNSSISLYGQNNFLKEAIAMTLPESTAGNNSHNANLMISISSDSLKSNMRRRDNFSGHYSFLIRGASAAYWMDELNMTSDSASILPKEMEAFYPYTIKFEQDSVSIDILDQIDDTLVWLDLSTLLPDGVYQKDELDTEFGSYMVLPFLKNTNVSIYIKSELDFKIEEEVKSLTFVNDIGEIKIQLNQMEGNLIKVNFTTSLKKRYLENIQDVAAYKAMLQKYREIVNKKWVLGLIKN